MYFVAPRKLNLRSCISVPVLLLGLVPLGSAQLIIKGRGLTGYGPTMDQPFLSNMLVPAFDAPGGFLLYNSQDPVWTQPPVDARPEEDMFRELPTDTTEAVSSRGVSVAFHGLDLTVPEVEMTLGGYDRALAYLRARWPTARPRAAAARSGPTAHIAR